MFMAHDPQIPSRQDRLKVTVGSISFLILIKASSTCSRADFVSLLPLFSSYKLSKRTDHGSTLVEVNIIGLQFRFLGWFVWVLYEYQGATS